MKIAIWGFGPYGQQLYHRIRFGGGERLTVAMVFDRNPAGLDRSRMPQGIEVHPSAELPALYRRGCFEQVLVGIYLPEIRGEVEGFLHAENIPVLSVSGMEAILSADPLFRRENRDVQRALEQIAGLCDYREVFDRLSDRESKDLFLARVFMELSGDESILLDTARLYRGGRRYELYELREPMRRCGAERVILFGGGADGLVNRTALTLSGIPIAALCSADPGRAEACWPDTAQERHITPVQLNDPDWQACLVIVSSQEEREQIRNRLKALRISPDRIYDPPGSWRALLTGAREGQYFDVWEPRDGEIFADCGAYNGQTILDFLNWNRSGYGAVHSLEPLPEMQRQLQLLREKHRIRDLYLYPFAVWNKAESLQFILEDDPTSSNVSSWGYDGDRTISVQGMPLDELLPGPVTFIKMDIEGSEMAALDGAQRLIRTYRPRLAISVYHRPLDVIFLARRILELVPDYRLKVRHYGAGIFETVLYASVDDWEDEAPDDETRRT